MSASCMFAQHTVAYSSASHLQCCAQEFARARSADVRSAVAARIGRSSRSPRPRHCASRHAGAATPPPGSGRCRHRRRAMTSPSCALLRRGGAMRDSRRSKRAAVLGRVLHNDQQTIVLPEGHALITLVDSLIRNKSVLVNYSSRIEAAADAGAARSASIDTLSGVLRITCFSERATQTTVEATAPPAHEQQ